MLHTLSPRRLFSSRRSITKLAVWLAFIAFLAIGSTQLRTPSHTSINPSKPVTLALAASTSNTATSPASPNSPAEAYQNTLNGALANKGLPTNPDHYLPALRWSGATSLYSNLGIGDVIGSIQIFIATLCFSIGSFIWTILFTVAKYALSADLLKNASYAIDSTFASLANTFTSTALLTVLLALTAGYAAVSYLRRGRGPGPFRIILAFIIPIGFLQTLALTANTSTANALAHGVSSSNYSSPLGAPAWLAVQADKFISDVINPISTGISSIGIGGNPITNDTTAPSSSPSCANYYAALDGQYQYELNQGSNATDLASLSTLSTIWQDSYLNEYTAAQFSTAPYASNASCRILEFNAHIPQNEQQMITQASYPNGALPVNSSSTLYGLGLSTSSNTQSQEESALWAYSACNYQNGQWTVNPGWDNTGSVTPITPAECSNWWNSGNTNNALVVNSFDQVQPLLTSSNGPTAQAGLEMSTLLGHEPVTSIIDGLVALITTIAMMITLGAVIVGSLLAQIGLIVLMIMLPASLFLVATPGKLRAIGTRLLKLTGGFLMGRFALTAALALITLLMGTMYNITKGTTSNPVIEMAIPILTIFLLRFLTKKAGFGSISSFQGAAMLPLAAAASLSGERSLSRSFSNARPVSTLASAPSRGLSALGQKKREYAITASKLRHPGQAVGAALRGEAVNYPLRSPKKDLASTAQARLAASQRASRKASTSPSEFALLASQAHGLTPGTKLGAKLQAASAGLGAKLTPSLITASLAGARLGAMAPPLTRGSLTNMAKNIGLPSSPLTSAQITGLRSTTAASLGLPPSAMLTSSSGISVMAPLSRSSSGALEIPPNYGPTATRAALGNGLNYLPASQIARRIGESDDAFATRMAATAIAAGLITESGAQADVLPAALGVEPNSDGSLPSQAEARLNTLGTNGGEFLPENAFSLGIDPSNFAIANAWLEDYSAPLAQPYEEQLQLQSDEIAALEHQREFIMENTKSVLDSLTSLGSLAQEFSAPGSLSTQESRINLESRLEAAIGAITSSLGTFGDSANLAATSVGIAQAALAQDAERIDNLAFNPQEPVEGVKEIFTNLDSFQNAIAPLYRPDASPNEQSAALSAISSFVDNASNQVQSTYQETLNNITKTSARLKTNHDLTAQSIATIAPQGAIPKSSKFLLRRNRVR
jgi:hypothetical protein